MTPHHIRKTWNPTPASRPITLRISATTAFNVCTVAKNSAHKPQRNALTMFLSPHFTFFILIYSFLSKTEIPGFRRLPYA
jgi:hypothetical protein